MHRTTVYDYLNKEADMAADPQNAPRHAGQVVRRMLLRIPPASCERLF